MVDSGRNHVANPAPGRSLSTLIDHSKPLAGAAMADVFRIAVAGVANLVTELAAEEILLTGEDLLPSPLPLYRSGPLLPAPEAMPDFGGLVRVRPIGGHHLQNGAVPKAGVVLEHPLDVTEPLQHGVEETGQAAVLGEWPGSAAPTVGSPGEEQGRSQVRRTLGQLARADEALFPFAEAQRAGCLRLEVLQLGAGQ